MPKRPSERGKEGICALRNGGGFSVTGHPHGERRVRHFLIWLGEGLTDREKTVLSGSSFLRSLKARERLPPGGRKGLAAQSIAGVKGREEKRACPLYRGGSHQRQAALWRRQGLTATPFFEWCRRAGSAGTRSFHRIPLLPAALRNTAWWGCVPGPAGEDGCQRPAAGTAGGPATL